MYVKVCLIFSVAEIIINYVPNDITTTIKVKELGRTFEVMKRGTACSLYSYSNSGVELFKEVKESCLIMF